MTALYPFEGHFLTVKPTCPVKRRCVQAKRPDSASEDANMTATPATVTWGAPFTVTRVPPVIRSTAAAARGVGTSIPAPANTTNVIRGVAALSIWMMPTCERAAPGIKTARVP